MGPEVGTGGGRFELGFGTGAVACGTTAAALGAEDGGGVGGGNGAGSAVFRGLGIAPSPYGSSAVACGFVLCGPTAGGLAGSALALAEGTALAEDGALGAGALVTGAALGSAAVATVAATLGTGAAGSIAMRALAASDGAACRTIRAIATSTSAADAKASVASTAVRLGMRCPPFVAAARLSFGAYALGPFTTPGTSGSPSSRLSEGSVGDSLREGGTASSTLGTARGSVVRSWLASASGVGGT
jgi:hypothetical protein